MMLVIVGVGLLWADTWGADAIQGALAGSLRRAFAPPHIQKEVIDAEADRVAATSRLDESNSGDAAQAGQTIGPPARPASPKRPRGLRDTTFVLLLGMDNRNDRITGRSDTIMIAAFRHRDGEVAAFSVPRDLWIDLPGLRSARINSTVRIGNHRLGAGRGIPLLRAVIEREFGIRVDHYAAVDLAGFVDVVDGVGGVEVDIACPIVDCFWTGTEGAACERLDVRAGRQTLDGATALMFARSRHGRGDRDRTRRQQAVVVALAREIRSRGLRGLPSLWRSARPYVDTDLDLEAALYYASFALETNLDEIGGFAITKPLVQRHVTTDNKHVLLLERERFDEALRRIFRTPLPAFKARKSCPEADVALTG